MRRREMSLVEEASTNDLHADCRSTGRREASACGSIGFGG